MKTSGTHRQQAEKQASKRREFMILLALLIPIGGGLFFLTGTQSVTVALQKPVASVLGQQVQQGSLNGLNGAPQRTLPAKYQIQGTVDDQYTLASDPQTGETLIHDSLGGLGTNSTSIDGDRAKLAHDMVDLEQYANDNKGKLSPETYDWLKKVARTGMQLAFGTPGLPASAQPILKKELLAEFHNISADPTKSFEHTDKYLSLEQVFIKPEEAYLANGSSLDKTNFLKVDPVSPALNTFDPALASISLISNLAGNTLEPSLASLSSSGLYYYTEPVTNALTTAAIDNTAIKPVASTIVGPGPTLGEYYDNTLGTQTTLTTSTAPTVATSTASATATSVSTSPGLNIKLGNVASVSVDVSATSGIDASAQVLSTSVSTEKDDDEEEEDD